MKIYDCFCYFNEDLILQLRFETLWKYVDYFVISEANYTHAGVPRNFYFDMNKFEKYASKIRYLPLKDRPKGENNFWRNENFIRDNLSNGLFDAAPEDLVIISDLDEIPNPKVIKNYDSKFYRGDFDQRYYSYYLNNYWVGDVDSKGVLIPKSNIWRGSKITTFNYFSTFFNFNATSVRSYKSHGILRSIKRTWFQWRHVQLIKDGGWHFTWIFSMSNLIKKIESTAHQEFNTEKFKDPSYILQMIKSGRDFHKPLARYKTQPLDAQFPEYLIKHKDKFKEFILS